MKNNTLKEAFTDKNQAGIDKAFLHALKKDPVIYYNFYGGIGEAVQDLLPLANADMQDANGDTPAMICIKMFKKYSEHHSWNGSIGHIVLAYELLLKQKDFAQKNHADGNNILHLALTSDLANYKLDIIKAICQKAPQLIHQKNKEGISAFQQVLHGYSDQIFEAVSGMTRKKFLEAVCQDMPAAKLKKIFPSPKL